MSQGNYRTIKTKPSSNVERVEYFDAESRLRVTFKSGSYEYEAVPVEVVDAWEKAPSSGKFYYANVRKKFDSHKVESETTEEAGG